MQKPHGPGIGSGTEPARAAASGNKADLRHISSLKKISSPNLGPQHSGQLPGPAPTQ